MVEHLLEEDVGSLPTSGTSFFSLSGCDRVVRQFARKVTIQVVALGHLARGVITCQILAVQNERGNNLKNNQTKMQNKTKFAIGDHVRVIESEDNDNITKAFIGREGKVERWYKDGTYALDISITTFEESELELIPVKTLENLEVGDVIKNCFNTLEVLAILAPNRAEKTCYLLSDRYGEYTTGSISLAGKLEKDGFTIYTPEPEKTDREKLVEEYTERIVNSECTSHTNIEYILKEFSKRLLK